MAWTPWGRLRDRVLQIEERLRALEASDATRETAFLSARDQLKRVLDRWRKREDRDGEEKNARGAPQVLGRETEGQGEGYAAAQARILARRRAQKGPQGAGGNGADVDGA